MSSSTDPTAPGRFANLGRAWVRVRQELFLDPGVTVRRVLLVFCCVQLVCLLWDLPTAYGWENDGAAPRGFFEGIAKNVIPGEAFRYPLFHYLLIGVLALPVLLVDVLVALATDSSIEHVVVSVPSMTLIALLTKLLHLGMSVVSLLAAHRIWQRLAGPRAALWALLFTLVNLTVVYYARSTNVDMPYLMWQVLALERILLLRQEDEPRHARWFGIFLAASVASKDQAYAAFVLTIPVYFVVCMGWTRLREASGPKQRRESLKRHAQQLLRGAGWTLGAYAVLSGAVFNPTGFLARVRLLTGENSQGWRAYPPGLEGWLANARDLIGLQAEFFWPLPLVVLAWLGALSAPLLVKGHTKAARYWAWFPLLAGLSNTLAFTLVVGRAEHRFLLVLGFWLSGYIGLLVAVALERTPGGMHTPALVVAGLLWLLGLKPNLDVALTQYWDPRHDVTAFLETLPAGTRVETYGLGVYLPYFSASDAQYRVTRVSAKSWRRAPHIPGIVEVKDDVGNIGERAPQVIVLPEGFASRFRAPRGESRSAMAYYRDATGALPFFQSLLDNRLPGYVRLRVGEPNAPSWFSRAGGRLVEIHGSTARPIWVFVRRDLAQQQGFSAKLAEAG